jgi:hypothetical protein
VLNSPLEFEKAPPNTIATLNAKVKNACVKRARAKLNAFQISHVENKKIIIQKRLLYADLKDHICSLLHVFPIYIRT